MKSSPFMLSFFLLVFFACTDIDKPSDGDGNGDNGDGKEELTEQEKNWVFIMAGQSNMAGRGTVEPQDTGTNPRIFTIDQNGDKVIAQEPLNYLELPYQGLDCGMSFAHALLAEVDEEIKITIINCAVGGSGVEKWLNDVVHRNVQLYTNTINQVNLAKEYGTIKGILWHQGESNATNGTFANFETDLTSLLANFRSSIGDEKLPIFLAELGYFLGDVPANGYVLGDSVNAAIGRVCDDHANNYLISAGGLNSQSDFIHFDNEAFREMGRRFAQKYKAELID